MTYLTNIRMERAKHLLLATALPSGEISVQCGYGDYRVFTKVFKKTEGVTPHPVPPGFSGVEIMKNFSRSEQNL